MKRRHQFGLHQLQFHRLLGQIKNGVNLRRKGGEADLVQRHFADGPQGGETGGRRDADREGQGGTTGEKLPTTGHGREILIIRGF